MKLTPATAKLAPPMDFLHLTNILKKMNSALYLYVYITVFMFSFPVFLSANKLLKGADPPPGSTSGNKHLTVS